MRHWAFVVAFLALVVSLFSSATAQNSRRSLTFTSSLPSYAPPIASALPSRFRPPSAVAQVPTPTPTPGFIPWYYPASPWPAPVASANAAIGGVFGAANIYNSGTSPLTTAPPGTGLLSVLGCYFICYGAPGYASHHVFAYGNDLGETSYTSQGAPDDCDEPGFHHCPAGVHDQIFSITLNDYFGAPNAGYFLALDGNSDLGVFGTIAAGGAIVAGAGNGTPAPSPAAGALVSHTASGRGELLLGSSGDFVTCGYGVPTSATLTCDHPVAANGLTALTGGVLPNGSGGGYAAEVFPGGTASEHPQILSGSCLVASATTCTFPGSRFFPDTDYNCTISAQGATAISSSYVKTSTTQITIHDSTITLRFPTFV